MLRNSFYFVVSVKVKLESVDIESVLKTKSTMKQQKGHI